MEKSDLQRFRNECVAAHNFYRAAHGTPPLCWSSRLAESAHNWAQQLASTSSLRYGSEKDIGENIACLWGSELNGQKVTRIWYEEGKYFDYDKPRFSSRTRSFCQVVWEGTREFGAAAAVTKHGKQIVVARYFPPANKKDVTRNVKKARSTRDNEQPLAYDTRWSRLYLGLKEFHEECLAVHNEYRLRHGAAPLQWSAELAWEAQQWAENLARSGELRHNDDDTVGENLAGMMGGELTGRETTDMWYEEIEDYDFDSSGYSEDTSNFTQIVWVASESLGVGRAVDGDLCVVVAFYEPPGNMEGSFGDNVLRMGSALRERKSRERKGFVPPPPDLESFRLECLVTHNYFRARHGSPPLVLSSALTDEAQYWAERLLVTGAMEGLDNSRIGISVAVLDKGHISGIKVSELWYKEILSYDFDSPGFSSETLDFSQLVWFSSRKFGVGKATGVEGVTVVVARYEPVGNIDGLFVQNVRRRGHDRGSCEPMIFHVEHRYRVRADSKSTNSFLSWEHEDTQTFGELEGDTTKTSCQAPPGNGLTRAKFLLNRLLEDLDRCRNSCYLSPPLSTAASLSWSDLDQFDENENLVHRADEQESVNTLTVSDHFTRLVWIDPNSPTLQRKGVPEKTTQDEDDDEHEDERTEVEEEDEDDSRTAYEQDNTPEAADLACVTEEPFLQMKEDELEEADLFSDPEHDLYQHVCEVRRSLSLDSEGTEPEMQRGNVLSKVAFFEMFQHGSDRQSPSNSESSLRRSLIQEELEELASRPKRQSHHEEEEGDDEEIVEEEHECQLEFDDLFPAHREADEEEVQVGEEIFDDEAEDEDESLVSVSDAEEVLDFTDYHKRHEGPPDYEYETNVCLTHEFVEEEPSTTEIFEFSDEDASHQYADITAEEDKAQSSRKDVYEPKTLSTATEFQKPETFKLCEDEPPDLMEDAPSNYNEEQFETSKAVAEVPQACFQRMLDPEFCYMAEEQKHSNIRMNELLCQMGLSPVEDSEEASADLADFNETIEGKCLETVINARNDRKEEDKRAPINEVYEAFLKDNVESEIDFEALFAKLERTETEKDETNVCLTHEFVEEEPSTMEIFEFSDEAASHQYADITEEEYKALSSQNDIYEPRTLSTATEFQKTETFNLCEGEPPDLMEDAPSNYNEEQFETSKAVAEVPQACFQRMLDPEFCYLAEKKEHVEIRMKELICQMGLLPVEDGEEASTGLTDFNQTTEGKHLETVINSTKNREQEDERTPVEEVCEAFLKDNVESEIDFEALFAKLERAETVKERIVDETRFELEQAESSETVQVVLRDHETERTAGMDQIGVELGLVSVDQLSAGDLEEEEIEPDIALDYECKPSMAVEPESAAERVNENTIESVIQDRQPEKQMDLEELQAQFEGKPRESESQEEFIQDKADRSREEQLYTAVRRDYGQERARVLEEANLELNLVTVSSGSTDSLDEPLEPLQYNVVPKSSTLSESPEVTEFVKAETRQDVRSEINFEEIFRHLDEEDTKTAEDATETRILEENVKETSLSEETWRASLYIEEDRTVDEIAHCIPSSPEYISHESKQIEPTAEIAEVNQGEQRKPALLYMEENTVIEEVATETPSSPKHIVGEGVNLEQTEVVYEESESSVDKRASLFVEEDSAVNEVLPDTPSSPKHIAGESQSVEHFENVDEEATEESQRKSLFLEEELIVDEVATEMPSSPKNISNESQNAESFDEINEETIEERERASVILEAETFVNTVITDTPSPKHIAGESRNVESFEETNVESIEESKVASVFFFEEESFLDEVAADAPSSPKHIASEIQYAESFDEINEEPIEESTRTSVFFEVKALAEEVTTDTPSHVTGERENLESFEKVYEEPSEQSKRTSLFVEEDSIVYEVTTDRPSSPKHIAGESQNLERFEEIHEEPTEESKRASLYVEEDSIVDVTTNRPSSPKHIVGENQNLESFEEVCEEPFEENKRASVFLEECSVVDEVISDIPSSPKHLAAESFTVELLEEVEEVPSEEKKRASLFLEEDTSVDEVTTTIPSAPIYVAGEAFDISSVDGIQEEETQGVQRAHTLEESDDEVTHSYISLESADQKNYVAGEFTNSGLLEVTDEDESPESDYGEQFEEFESVYGTQRFLEPLQTTHIAGEINNTDTHDEALEEVLQLEETVEYDDSPEMVTQTDILETSQPSFHIAGELSNIEPQEESSEEEKPDEGGCAEEIEETEVQASTIVLKSPQSLLSIAAAALELKIDAAQQEKAEVVESRTEIVEQYSEQEQTELQVPTIFVDIASDREVSDSEEDETYYVEEEQQDDREIETEMYEDSEEAVVSYPTEEQLVSSSHVAAEICESEITLEIEDIKGQREIAEPFEESEEGSVSELMSECSLSPLHVSCELKDFQDYETINEEYDTETYHTITYEESDYVSDKSVSKGLSPLYITEELPLQEIYAENILNEKLVMIETAQAYNEVEEPLETETSLGISEPPLQTAAELSDSDYNGGVEDDDDLSERDFLEEFEEMEEVVGHEIPLASSKEPATVVSEIVGSGPQTAEKEEECLDEADNAQMLFAQEPLVSLEQHSRNVEEERVVHKPEKSQDVWQMELKEGSRIVESTEEKGFASEIHKFMVVSEKETSVEIKSSYQVVERKETKQEEPIFMGEKAEQIEISQEFGENVEVLATSTTRQVSSTSSYVATGFASEEIYYKADTNGSEGILHGEVKKIQEVTFTPINQSSRQTSWVKKENGGHVETTDQLSESILEKEAKDQESEKFERQLSEDEREVRLLKSEVMEYKATEQQAPLENPRVTVERETTFMKSYIVHSGAKDTQEVQQVMRQDDVLVLLKDDEASLEEESAGEQFEEEIDIMRMDEALSEEEFRGEVAESIDRSQSRSSKADSVEEIDKRDQKDEGDTHECDQEEPLYEEEVDISEVRPVEEEEMEVAPVEELHQEEEISVNEGDQQEPLYEEVVDISEVQPVYEEELEIQKVQEQEEEKSIETKDSTVQTSKFEEEIEVAAYVISDEPVEQKLEHKPVEKTEFMTHSAEFEEELEVTAFKDVKEESSEKVESGDPTAVLEEEEEIPASREQDREALLMEYEERETTEDMERSEQLADDESTEHVETTARTQPMDLTQVDLYDEEESATTRYYVELSSTESLEPAFEEVEDETAYTETYVRQGDPLEENLEEFILVRYSDEYDSSGEEDISDHREIYVIPEEENDVENNNVEKSARDELKGGDQPLPESSYEEGFENMGLEEIRESPEFEMEDSPEDELDEEEQRQLEEYERLESFVILEEKLSQVESDEDCDDDNGGFKGEEGDENVFHSDVHSSSDETLHEDELAETMIASSIRQGAVSTEADAKKEEKTDEQISGEHQEYAEDSSSRTEGEIPTQEGDALKDSRSEKGDEKDASVPKEPSEEKELSDTKEEKTEHNGDSSGEQSVASEGSLSSTPSVDLEELDDFEENCLLEHNLYRRQHRAKPLKWSEELAAAAKEWVEHMASVNCLERCERKEVGQNLASAQGKELNGTEVVEMWYKEATDYNFEVPAFNAKCGNFTQVVWASSREFGVAKCLSDDGTQYVAAFYKPAGNIVGEFKDNVKPPRDSSDRLKRRRSSARRRSRSGVPPETPAEREKFKTECVISHNYYRTFHNAPPLRWSPLLAAEAHNYAERLVKTGSLTHSGQKDRGENLAYTWDSPLTARAAVDMWYDEVQDYDFDCPGYTSDTGHFTQLVWVGTEEFGMGMAVAPDGRNVVVGRYFPPGNIVGQFKENVWPRQIAGIP